MSALHREEGDRLASGGAAPRPPTVLLLADEGERRRRTTRLLERQCVVHTADHGERALELAREQPPDLVVVDRRCSHPADRERLHTLRAEPEFRGRPFLVLWPRSSFQPNLEGMDPVIDDHLIEPFTSSELLARVEARARMALLRRQAEEALAVSEQRFRGLVEQIAQAFWETDACGQLLGDSHSLRSATGLTEEEWHAKGWLAAVCADDGEEVERAWHKSLITEEPLDILCRLRQPDGNWTWSNLRAAPLWNSRGELWRWTWMCIDLTERKQHEENMERDLRDMRRLQRISTRLIPEADPAELLEEILLVAVQITAADYGTLHLLAEDSDILHMSVFHGFTPEAARGLKALTAGVGRECVAMLASGQRIVVPDLDADALGVGGDTEQALRRAGVRAFQATPLLSRAGQLLGILSTDWRDPHQPQERELRLMDLLARQTADVVERHRSEVALHQRERSLWGLSRTLERRVAERTAELREQAAMLRSLAVELSSTEQRERKRLAALLHDGLQQLLVASKMHLGMARARSTHPKATEAVEMTMQRIDEAIDASRDLTRELRPPVLYEAGLLPALEWLATQCEQRHGVHVHVHAGELPSPLSDDAKAMLFECARELLFNVSKHAGVDQAQLELSERGGRLHMSVADAGKGFDLHAGPASQGGFGLFSIRERIAALGGSAHIRSRAGGGTLVELELPLVPPLREPPREEKVDAPSPPPVREPEAATDGRTRVLVVDDHALVRSGIAHLVDSDEHMIVIGEASDGIEALALIAEEQPEVVLVDVHMPRMNGVETAREIHRRWPDIAVIGLSVQGEEATARSMLDAGAVAFLPKAGDFALLASTIAEHRHAP